MNFNIDVAKIDESFLRIANELMNNHVIQVKDVYYRIVDCEFYFKNEIEHNDIYTHGHDMQLENGSWYFHGSGIDITIGNKDENSKGGILIRGITKVMMDKKNSKGDYVDIPKKPLGPIITLTTLFSHFSNVLDNTNSFFLIEKNKTSQNKFLTETELFRCKRKGLNSDKNNHDNYFDKLYRFIAYPYLPHAEKESIRQSLKENYQKSDSQIKQLVNPW